MRDARSVRAAGAAILVTALAAPTGVAHGAERALTLDEAVALALRHDEGVLVQREELDASSAAVTGARGAYDPLLELTAGWERISEPVNSELSGAPSGELSPTSEVAEAGVGVTQLLPTGGSVSLRASAARATTDAGFTLLSPAYGTQVGVELRQPLLRRRAVDSPRTALHVTSAERDAAAASLQGAISETIAAVERSYWRLVAARLEVGVREEAVRLAEEQLEETLARIENGVVPETEEAQPRAEIERRRGELLETMQEVALAENDLKLLILDDLDGDLWLDSLVPAERAEVDIAPVDAAAAMETALASRPELAGAAAEVERARAEHALARDGVRPSLDAVLSYDRFGLAGEENSRRTPFDPNSRIPSDLDGGLGRSWGTLGEGHFEDTRVGMVFGIPLGNRSARSAAAAALSAERQAQVELSRIRKRIRADVLDAAAALQTAAQRIEAARAAREAAEVQLSSEKERYGVGLSTNFLVLTRQNDLSLARLAEIAALTDYRTARAELGRATGSLLQERGIEIEEAASVRLMQDAG